MFIDKHNGGLKNLINWRDAADLLFGKCSVVPRCVLALALWAVSLGVYTQNTWDGGGPADNWGDPLNWNNDILPGAGDNVTIGSVVTVTVDIPNAICNNLIIGNGQSATVQITDAANALTIGGTLTLGNATAAKTCILDAGPGTITIAGIVSLGTGSGDAILKASTGTMTVSSAIAVNDADHSIVLRDAGTIAFGGLVSHSNGLISNTTVAGTLSFNAGYTRSNAAAIFTTMAAQTIKFGGNFTNSGGALTLNATSTAAFNNGTPTITPTAAITFGNVSIESAVTVTLGGNITVVGDWTNNNGLLTYDATKTITFQGENGVGKFITGNTATTFPNLVFSSGGASDVIYTLDVDASCTSLKLAAAYSANLVTLTHGATRPSLTVAGDATIYQTSTTGEERAWYVNGGTATVGGDLGFIGNSNTAGRLAKVNITTGDLTVTGEMVFDASITNDDNQAINITSTGTVTFMDIVGTDATGEFRDGNLYVTGGGTMTFNAAFIQNAGSGNVIVNAGGTLVFNSTFLTDEDDTDFYIESGAKVKFNNNLDFTCGCTFTFSEGSEVVLIGDATLNATGTTMEFGSITIEEGVTFTIQDDIRLMNDWTNLGGTFVSSNDEVRFDGTYPQTITAPGGETFYDLELSYSGTGTEGLLTLAEGTNVTVTNILYLNNGLINLNENTLTLGVVGNGGDLDLSGGGDNNWMYGGTFKRFWTDGAAISSTAADQEGLFPMGTADANSYRPLEFNSTVNNVGNGWVAITHVDATDITDLDPVYNDGGTNIVRISNAQFLTTSSGITGGTFNVDVTMTGLSTVGAGLLRLAVSTGGTTASALGTHAAQGGTAANPTVKRTGLTAAQISQNNDFRVATTNSTTNPIRQMYYSRKTGIWTDATPGDGTWSYFSGGAGASCDCTPSATGYAVINTGHTVSVNASSTIGYLDIQTGGIVDGGGAFTLNVGVDLTTKGTGKFTPTSTGAWTVGRNLTLAGSGASSTGGALNISNNMDVGAGTSLTVGGNSQVNGRFVNIDGTLDIGATTFTFDINADQFFSGSAGAAAINGNGQLYFNNNDKVFVAGSNLTIAPEMFINNEDFDNYGTINLNNNLKGQNNANSRWYNRENGVLNITGTLFEGLNARLYSAYIPNTVNYAGAGTQVIKNPQDGYYYNLTISGNGTKNLASDIEVVSQVIIQDASVCDQNANSFFGSANFTMSDASQLITDNATVTAPEFTGTYNITGGTISFDNGGNQTIRGLSAGPSAYYNLELSNTTTTKTLGGNIHIQNDLTIVGSAELDVSSSNYNVTIDGDWIITSTDADPFIERQGKVIFNGNSPQTLSTTRALGETFYDLTVASTAGLTLNSDGGIKTNIARNLTISSLGILIADNVNPIEIQGDWINNGGTFTPGGGVVTFNGTTQSMTKSSAETFGNLIFQGSATKTMGCDLSLSGNLQVNGTASLDASVSNYDITLAGDWTIASTAGDPFVQQNGMVTFNGSALQTITTTGAGPETFYDLSVSNNIGGVILADAITVQNDLSITNAGLFNAAGFTMAIKGDWASNGTFTPNANTVTFSGTEAQTITNTAGETFYNLTSNCTGPINFQAATDVTVTNTLNLTNGVYDLNGRTLSLGILGTNGTLTRTGSSTTNWVYGGTFKRFWQNGSNLSVGNLGLFPMGTANASSYRPFHVTTTVNTVTDGYYTVSHVDAVTTTDLSPYKRDGAVSDSIRRISDAQFETAISGITGGTFDINATMTGLSSVGSLPGDGSKLRLCTFVGGTEVDVVGTHADATGTDDNPTVKRTGITTIGDLAADFRVGTLDKSTDPIRSFYYSRSGGGDWNATATWSTAGCGGAEAGSTPPTDAYCVICSGDIVTVNVLSTADFVEINSGGSLVGGSGLTISSDLTTAGTGSFAPTGGTWTVTRNATLAGTGTSSCTGAFNVTGNLNVGSGTSLTLGASSSVTGNLVVDGTLDIGTTTLTLNGTSDKTLSGSAGAAIIGGAGGKLSVTVASKTIPAGTSLSMTPVFEIAANLTVTNNGTISLVDDLTGLNAASTWVNATGATLNAGAAVLTTGVLTATAVGNTVNYNGSGAQAIKKTTSSQYYNLTCSNAGTKTFGTAGTLTVNNMVTVSDAAVLNVSTNTLNGTAGLTMSGTADLQLARSATQPELAGSYNITGGTITLNGAGIQTIRSLNAAPATYYNLVLGNAAAKSMAGPITILDKLTIGGTASLDVTATNYAILLSGDWYVSSAAADPFVQRSGTVTFNGGSAQTITTTVLGTETFYDLVINNGAGVTLVDPIVVSDDLTIASGAAFNASGNNITIAGDWDDQGGTFTPAGNTVDFNGTTQSLSKTTDATFYNIIFSNSGTKTLGCNVAVNNLSIQGTAVLDVSTTNYAISLTGNWNVTSIHANPFTERNGTVSFIGTSAQTITTVLAAGETFYHLSASNNSVGIQLIDDITISGNLTLNSGVVFDANGLNMTIAGNWTNSGATFTPGVGTVTFSGSGNKTITNTAGENFYNLTSNTTGVISLESNTDITITNQLTMTAGNYNLNARTLTLGNGSAANLTRTSGVVYGGSFKRYLAASAVTGTKGLFPIGTATGYRPVLVTSTADPTSPGYLTATHTDANSFTDVSYTDNEPVAIDRIADMKSTLAASGGLAGGTYDLSITMTDLTTVGLTTDLKLETYTDNVMGDAGTTVVTSGSVDNPTVGRTGLTLANLGNDFVVGTKDKATSPLQQYYYSRKDGTWDDVTPGDGTWSLTSGGAGASCDCEPPSNGHAVISAGQTVTLTNANETVEFVDIENGAVLDGIKNLIVNQDVTTAGSGAFAPAAGLWTIYGDLILTGSGNASLSGVSVVSGNVDIGAGTTLTMNGGAGITISGNLNVDGTFVLGTSTATLDGANKTISGSAGAAIITTGAGGTINITTNKTISSGTDLNIEPLVSITGARTITNNGTITLTGNLTGSLSTSTWTNGAASTLNMAGTLLATGTLNASAVGNIVNYNKPGDQAVKTAASNTYYNLILSNSGTKTAAADMTISNNLTIEDAALLQMSTNALTGAGGLTMSGTAELLLARLSTSVPALTGSYSLTGGTIRFNGAGAQTIKSLNGTAPAAYYNVDFATSGVKTLAGAITIQGEMSISGSSQLDVTTSNYAITLGGDWNASSTNGNPFVERSGLVTFNGAAAQTITSSVLGTETFYNLTINNAAGVTLVDPVNVTSATGSGNALTIESGAIFDCGNQNISLTGNWTDNGGTFTAGTAMVTFNGNGAQAITKSSASTFYDITFGGSGTTTLGCDLNVQRDLLISSTAILDVSTSFYTIDVDRHWTVSSTAGDPFVERSGTVIFSGAAAQNQSTVLTAGETFYGLTINNPVGVTFSSAGGISTNISGLLTISSAAILLGNDHNINMSGDWTNNGGTFTPGATGTVTFIGAATMTITNTAGETFNNLTSNCTGTIILQAATDITVTKTLTMTAGLYNLNGRALTLGVLGTNGTLSRAASATTNWFYGGTFKRFWQDGVAITTSNVGLFPMGTSSASTYRPFTVSTTSDPVTDGYFTVTHVDASAVTDLSPVYDDAGTDLQRIANAQFMTTIDGVTGGTFDINLTMTHLSTTGTALPNAVLRLATFTGGTTASAVGTHADGTGTPANPTVKRTGLTIAEMNLNSDFRVATTNTSTDPLQQIYYSRGTGNWNVAGSWSTIGCDSAAAGSAPPSNGYCKICSGHTITVNANSTIAYVDIEDGGAIDGTFNLTVSKDLTTSGTGIFVPTSGVWAISRDLRMAGTGSSSLAGTSTVSGDLDVGAGTTLTMSGGAGLTVGGNLIVDGTLALGTSTATLSGSSKTISGSAGAASITGAAATINITADKTISSGANLSIAPLCAIVGAKTVTNSGSVTLTGNLTGSAGGSTWTNAAGSTLNAGGAVMATGVLNASASNTVNYYAAGGQTIKTPAANIYYNLKLSTSGTKSAAGNLSISNNLTVQGSAVLDMSTLALTGAGGLTMTGSSGLILARTGTTVPALTGSYSLSGGTITFDGAGAQTVKSLNAAAPAAYYHVDFGNSGVKTLAGAITVQGQLSISDAAQLDVSVSNYAIKVAGNWHSSSAHANPFVEQSGTITCNGTSAQTITSSVLGTETFYSLVINNPAGVTLVDPINLTSPTGTGNALTIQSGAILDAGNQNISLTGNWIDNGGTFTPGTGKVTFNGTGAQAITKSSTATFYDITFSSSGVTTLGCDLNVTNDLVVAGTASLDVSTTFYAITLSGANSDFTVTSVHGDPFVERSGTVTFSGSSQNQSTVLLAGETFYNLVVGSSTGLTLNSGAAIPTNITNQLTINSGKILLGNNHNINMSGAWTNSGGTYTPGATGTVTFVGSGTMTITNTAGETFNNLTSNCTGTIALQASTNVAVTNTLTMTAGLYNLNGRTLTLGVLGANGTLSRAASTTTNWFYGGTFKRFWQDGVAITASNVGLFPMGTSSASSYRPFTVSTTVNPVTDGYFNVTHTDASGVTDLSPVYDDGGTNITRISDALFTTVSSGTTGGTFDISATMTQLSSTGTTPPGAILRLAVFEGGTTASAVGTHAAGTGTPANPTVNRTGITTMADLSNDFCVATTNTATDPLQQIFYSTGAGANWDNGANWATDGCGGAVTGTVPPANGYVKICSGHTITVNTSSTIAYVDIEDGGTLNGTANLIVSKDITTSGTGVFAPTSGTWTISRDLTLSGTGSSSLSGSSTVTGNLTIGSGTTLTMNGGAGITVAGNLAVNGTLALGTSTATLSGSAKIISGSGGAASVTGASALINVTSNKSIASGSALTIAPTLAIVGAYTVTNSGTVTLTGNLTGSAAASTWTNAAGSVLNTKGAVMSTGVLNASASNTVNYYAGGAQSVKRPATSYYNLKISGTGTSATFGSAGTISVSNNLTLSDNAVFNVSTNTLSGAGGLTMSGTAELQLARLSTTVPALTGAYSLTGGTIRFNGAGAQTIRSVNGAAPAAYYGVVFGTSGVKTLAGSINVQDDLVISGSAQLDVTASNYDITIGGDWNSSSTNGNPFVEQGGEVIFNGTAAQTITSSVLGTETFYDLTISNAAGVTLVNPIGITSSTGSGNSLTIGAGAVFDAGNQNISITGNWINNGGSLVPGTGTVTFNGTGSQSITKASPSTFNDIVFTNSSVTTLACDLTINNDLLISGTAQLDVSTSSYAIDVNGDFTVTSTLGDPFVERSGTVTFSGAAAQTQNTVLTAGETFYNLVIDNPSGVTLTSTGPGPATISNLLTINSGADLVGNARTINIAGSWTNTGGTYSPTASSTVAFTGAGTQTITNTGGETFNNLTSNCTGIITLEASTDIVIQNTLTMTSGRYNLNARTLTLGTASSTGTLSRAASSTTNWVYGGTFKRFWPNATVITITNVGLFPMGTSSASSYRPFTVACSGGTTTDGYFTVNHTDAAGITDLDPAQPEGMVRVANSQFITAISGVTAGTFDINLTMTQLSATGTTPGTVLRLAKSTGATTAGVVGTSASATGTPANPTVRRTGISTVSDLNNDFRVATTNDGTDPLQDIYYSRASANWNLASTWSTVACDGAAAASAPPANGFCVICSGHNITVNAGATISYVNINDGGYLAGTANLTVTKDVTTSGSGYLAPTAGAWTISRNLTLAGTGSSSLISTTVAGDVSIGSGTTLTMSGGAALNIAGNMSVNGTLALGTSTATLSGATKTIGGNTGAASITGAGATLNVTANKTIPATATLTIEPVFSINGAYTVSNSGAVTLTGNLTGSAGGSTWTNAAGSTLNVGEALLATGTLNASGANNTVNYNKAGDQTIKAPASTYYNVTLATSGTKTLGGAISLQNNLLISGTAVLDVSGSNLGINLGGNWTNNGGSFTTGTGTVTFNGTAAQAINGTNASQTFYDLVVAKTAGQTLSVGGSTTTLTVNDFIQTSGNFDATGASTALDINGSVLLTTGTFTPPAATTVLGDWTTAGAATFSPGAGTVNLMGTTAMQTISGVAVTFNNLTFNNAFGTAPQITLSATVSLNGLATFSDGIVASTATNLLIFNDDATSGDASDASHVDGPVRKIGDDTFIFPTGDAGIWAPIGLETAPSVATDAFTAEYFYAKNANADIPCTNCDAGVNHVSVLEYWDLERTAGASTPDVTMYFKDMTRSRITTLSDLIFAHWDGDSWERMGVGTGVSDGANMCHVTGTGFTSYSPDAPASEGGDNPLPIELLYFDATLNGDQVDLAWVTESETNNDYFSVERSADGVHFEQVAVVPGSGNSTGTLRYSATDRHPLVGVSYYRIKQTDYDGSYAYSQLVAVKVNKDRVFVALYPNPTYGRTYLKVKNLQAGEKIYMVIVDNKGHQVYTRTVTIEINQETAIAIDVADQLPAGIYFIGASTGSHTFFERLVILK